MGEGGEGQWELVEGLHRMPLLLGPVDAGVRTWRGLHRRLAHDLHAFLCNAYFQVERGEGRVEEPREYAVDVDMVRGLAEEEDAKEAKGEEKQHATADDDYQLLPPSEDGELGEAKRRKAREQRRLQAEAHAALTARLQWMELAHQPLVREVRQLDGMAKADLADPYAVLPHSDAHAWRRIDLDAHTPHTDSPPQWKRRRLQVTLSTRRRGRKGGLLRASRCHRRRGSTRLRWGPRW